MGALSTPELTQLPEYASAEMRHQNRCELNAAMFHDTAAWGYRALMSDPIATLLSGHWRG
jgi:hypothetical protein